MGYSAPRGTVDILPGQSEKWIKLEQLLRTIAANYNVKEMRTPIFEHAELFNRAVGDTSDVVSKEMYTFQDKKFIIWDQCLDMKDLKMVDKDNSTNLG